MKNLLILRVFCFFLSCLIFPSVCYSEWVKVASTLEDDSFFYVSSESIKSSDKNLKSAWELVNIPNGAKDSYKSLKTQQEYDCKSNKLRMLYASTHSEIDGKGKTITIAKGLPSPWRTIPEGSVATHTRDYICSKK